MKKHTSEKRKQLINQLNQLDLQEHEEKGRKRFKCACGKSHMLKTCILLQNWMYEYPSGYEGGGYGPCMSYQIVCPNNNIRNRLLFDNVNIERNFGHLYASTFNGKLPFAKMVPIFIDAGVVHRRQESFDFFRMISEKNEVDYYLFRAYNSSYIEDNAARFKLL